MVAVGKYEDEELLEIAAWVFFFVGMAANLWGDVSQASLKTVALLALSALVAIPIYDADIPSVFFYVLFSVMWIWLLYAICNKESALHKTYNRQLDVVPAVLFCLLPSLVGAGLVYFFINGGDGIGRCRALQFKSGSRGYCTDLVLYSVSSAIDSLAFVPQVAVIFRLWNAGESLKLKICIYCVSMIVCYSLRSLMWVWSWNKVASELDGFHAWDLYRVDTYAYFFFANLMAVSVICFPWVYRLTCMRCCGPCCGAKDTSIDAEFDSTLGPNTGHVNEVPEKEEVTTGWFWTSKQVEDDGEERLSRPGWFSRQPTEQADEDIEAPAVSRGSSVTAKTAASNKPESPPPIASPQATNQPPSFSAESYDRPSWLH